MKLAQDKVLRSLHCSATQMHGPIKGKPEESDRQVCQWDDGDFIKESKQIDLRNEGTVSLHVPQVCRVIRLKLGTYTAGIKDTQAERREDQLEASAAMQWFYCLKLHLSQTEFSEGINEIAITC